jgi:hypothetical protein
MKHLKSKEIIERKKIDKRVLLKLKKNRSIDFIIFQCYLKALPSLWELKLIINQYINLYYF